MGRLTDLERSVLDKILHGDAPILRALQQQAASAVVSERELTGTGFMTRLTLPRAVPRAPVKPGMIRFGDVEAQIEGLQYGAGFLVYVRDGFLAAVEGYSYEEPWPTSIGTFSVKYMSDGRDFGELQPSLSTSVR